MENVSLRVQPRNGVFLVAILRFLATVSVGQLLDQLPERYRQAVTLFYMEDKSYEQTAESLGLPLGTVKALLHRARKRLIELTRESENTVSA